MGLTPDLDQAEQRLDSLQPEVRRESLALLVEAAAQGRVSFPPPTGAVNLHGHTFFSYNAYGYSPSHFAWLARRAGLAVAGITDFDVLDGVEEFLEAARPLQLRACASIETRVFLPEFADKVMNSPGEPGICYHMGAAMPRGEAPADWTPFLRRLRKTAAGRNRDVVERVNRYLSPVVLDYAREVLPLTPGGSATERHICLAYARKAHSMFGDGPELAQYWADRLGAEVSRVELPESMAVQALIRAKTMKLGGVGYVQPDTESFPRMEEMNRFVLAAGGLPTYAWLDGTNEGESDLEKLMAVAVAQGAAAVNVIPDRNYTRGRPDQRLRNLYAAVELAEHLGLPVMCGTEMNAPGQKLADDFDAPELARIAPVLLKGAHILYAHSALQRHAGMGYTSEWAQKEFPQAQGRNSFFEECGLRLSPGREAALSGLSAEDSPSTVLGRLAG